MIIMGDKKKTLTAILGPRSENIGERSEIENGGVEDSLLACAEELISAVHAKDAQGVVEALQAAFEHMEMQPHAENMEGHE
jgi:predicted outer membrane lipoprotein